MKDKSNDTPPPKSQMVWWRPIETAPKGASGISWMLLAHGPSDDLSIGTGMRFNDQFFAASTFYRGGNVGTRQFEFREHEVFPTHWMPMPKPPALLVGSRYCIRCGGVEHIPEDDITCTICVEAIRNGTEPNGADRSPKPKRQLPVLDVEEIASMLYEAANPTMRWSYLYPSHNHLHAAVRQRFLDAASRFQGALASAEAKG